MSYKIPIPEENISNKPASQALYIGIWFAWIFSTKILGFIGQEIYFYIKTFTTLRDVNDAILFLSVMNGLIIAATFIFIYNLFPKLNIKKVMPFLYFAGVVTFLRSYFDYNSIPNLEFSPLLQFYVLIGIIIPLYFIRKYYIAKPARWY